MSMERHKCKLCSRSFSSGRALGGHMRSHLATLPLPPKTPQKQELGEPFGERSESTLSLCSSEEEVILLKEVEESERDEKILQAYGLRENPRKSFRLVDPEFFDAGSVVHDMGRESETESSRKPTRRRSKRNRRMMMLAAETEEEADQESKEKNLEKPSSTESLTELESVSPSSDAFPEEEVAVCLMMLSRDVWSFSDELKCGRSRRWRTTANGGANNEDQKVHECPFCGKIFGSGQALGGHKRSHLMASSGTTKAISNSAASFSFKVGEALLESNSGKFHQIGLIDLNLPAPLKDEDFSQQEVSAVSDADFINPIKY